MGYIAIVDYGAGNLMSVHNTLDFLGYENKVASTGEVIENAAGVILPGVGAFPDAMAALTGSGLTDAVLKAAETKPCLLYTSGRRQSGAALPQDHGRNAEGVLLSRRGPCV